MRENRNYLYQSAHTELNVEYKYTVEINSTFLVFVKSYGFSGSHEFCMRNEQINESISNLIVLDESFTGKCMLVDTDSDAFIFLEFENKRIKVTGQLGGSYDENFMRFSFFTDQTLIKLLINVLQKSLNE